MSEPSEIDWEDVSEDSFGDEPLAPMTAVIGSWSNLPRPDLIVPETFVSNPLCIPMQIAAATEEKLDTVLRRFDDIFNGKGWRDQQITPRHIIRYATDTHVSLYMYLGSRLEHVDQRNNTNKPAIVFAYWCGRVYFYKGMGPTARGEAQKRYAQNLSTPAEDVFRRIIRRRI